MKRFSNYVLGYQGPNPFSDSQARNFSDLKVSKEFYPISNFWSLFNDQHEVLLGSRGCGKTFLLKMMRYSMLKKISDPNAEELIKSKEFISIYVPMHLEFVTPFNDPSLSAEQQIIIFQIEFNCIVAESLIVELKSLLEEIEDPIERVKKSSKIVEALNEIWFNEKDSEVYELDVLSNKISKLFYNIDWKQPDIESIPVIFKRQICSSLLAAKTIISQIFKWAEEPTWIVCIDEAEFLNETLQKCINSMFRSDTGRIALKIATLPYFHKTLETLDPSISVVNGNDFVYRVIDMKYDSKDFIGLTNALCSHRLETRFDKEKTCSGLEEFLGVIGNDDQIDYYRNEFGEEAGKRECIEQKIIDSFLNVRKENARTYKNPRKTVYDKFAPIFFVREMYALSKQGNSKPGWFAGATVVRKVSQGNPRLFIQLMSELFEIAKKTELYPKTQNGVIYSFAEKFCNSTQALESKGPIIYQELNKIATYLHDRTHGEGLISVSCAFNLKYKDDLEIEESRKWIQLAIAYSRLIVDDDTKINGITIKTKYLLANAYAAAYWLPMRGDTPASISVANNLNNKYIVERKNKNNKNEIIHQMSLFEEENEWY